MVGRTAGKWPKIELVSNGKLSSFFQTQDVGNPNILGVFSDIKKCGDVPPSQLQKVGKLLHE